MYLKPKMREDVAAFGCTVAAYLKNTDTPEELPLGELCRFANFRCSRADPSFDTLSFVRQDVLLLSLLGTGRVLYVSTEHERRWHPACPKFAYKKMDAMNSLHHLRPQGVAVYVDKHLAKNVYVFSKTPNASFMVFNERREVLAKNVPPAQLASAVSNEGVLTIFEERT